MKVLIVEPGQYPREAEIAKSLKAEQAVVGGLIECVYPWQDNACIVCNDEGKLEGLPLNRTLDDYDVIAGTFFVVGLTEDDFCSLTNEQVERYKAMFFKPQLFVPYRGGLMQVPYTNPDLPNKRLVSHVFNIESKKHCKSSKLSSLCRKNAYRFMSGLNFSTSSKAALVSPP